MNVASLIVIVGVALGTFLFIPAYGGLLKRSQLTATNYRGYAIPISVGLVPAFFAAMGNAIVGVFGYISGFVIAFSLLAVALLGLLDDVTGDKTAQGFRGHFSSFLFHGHISSGLLKALGIPLIGLIVAATFSSTWFWILFRAVLMSLSANTMNLLDVRPGRAVKGALIILGVAFLVRLPDQWIVPWCLCVVSLLAYAPYDLRQHVMLGDSGANVFGFIAGLFLIGSVGVVGSWVFFIIMLILHAVAELSSISIWIDRIPLLRRIDRWGT